MICCRECLELLNDYVDGTLDEKIKELPGLKPVSEFKKDRVSFHEFWWVLVLLLVMLSVEWVVRKLHSML